MNITRPQPRTLTRSTPAPLQAKASSEPSNDSAPVSSTLDQVDLGSTASPSVDYGRLGKSVGTGLVTTAFGAMPGFGLLMGLNAGDSTAFEGTTSIMMGVTTLARVGGVVASAVTGSAAPYVAGVALNAVTMGVGSAVAEYRGK